MMTWVFHPWGCFERWGYLTRSHKDEATSQDEAALQHESASQGKVPLAWEGQIMLPRKMGLQCRIRLPHNIGLPHKPKLSQKIRRWSCLTRCGYFTRQCCLKIQSGNLCLQNHMALISHMIINIFSLAPFIKMLKCKWKIIFLVLSHQHLSIKINMQRL